MSKLFNKFITARDYADKVLLVFSSASNGSSICLFTTVIGEPIDIDSPSISLVFLVSDGILKKVSKNNLKVKRRIHENRFMGY